MSDGSQTHEHDPWTDPKFEQEVRDTAYFLWEADNRPPGREQEYWFRALEKCLRKRQYDSMLGQPPEDDGDGPA